jgi:hypothetical protein
MGLDRQTSGNPGCPATGTVSGAATPALSTSQRASSSLSPTGGVTRHEIRHGYIPTHRLIIGAAAVCGAVCQTMGRSGVYGIYASRRPPEGFCCKGIVLSSHRLFHLLIPPSSQSAGIMHMWKLSHIVALGHMASLARSMNLERRLNNSLGLTPHLGWSSWVRDSQPKHNGGANNPG